MTYSFFRTTPWLSVALIVGMTGCQSRSRQTMVVEREDNGGQQQQLDGSTGGGTTSGPDNGNGDAGAAVGGNGGDPESAKTSATGKLTVNGWTGEEDENAAGNAWTVAKGSATVAATAVASDSPTTVIPSGTTNSAAVTYDGRIVTVLGACTRCHGATGQDQPKFDTYDLAKANIVRIIARSQPGQNMPPQGSVPTSDLQALQAWQATGMQKSGGSVTGGTTSTTPPAGNGLVLEIRDRNDIPNDKNQVFYLNDTPVNGRVGQTLKIVNRRTSGSFTIHTNGSPFGHGDSGDGPRTLGPGESVDIQLQSPYQGNGGVYEHVDGDVYLNRSIKMTVTQ